MGNYKKQKVKWNLCHNNLKPKLSKQFNLQIRLTLKLSSTRIGSSTIQCTRCLTRKPLRSWLTRQAQNCLKFSMAAIMSIACCQHAISSLRFALWTQFHFQVTPSVRTPSASKTKLQLQCNAEEMSPFWIRWMLCQRKFKCRKLNYGKRKTLRKLKISLRLKLSQIGLTQQLISALCAFCQIIENVLDKWLAWNCLKLKMQRKGHKLLLSLPQKRFPTTNWALTIKLFTQAQFSCSKQTWRTPGTRMAKYATALWATHFLSWFATTWGVMVWSYAF